MPMAQQKKKGKAFLENKDAALTLANLIVDDQEGKAKKKVEKHQHSTQNHRDKGGNPSSGSKYTKSRKRLEEAKIAVAARAAQARREKAKARHAAKKGEHLHPEQSQPSPQSQKAKPQRRVMFAEEP